MKKGILYLFYGLLTVALVTSCKPTQKEEEQGKAAVSKEEKAKVIAKIQAEHDSVRLKYEHVEADVIGHRHHVAKRIAEAAHTTDGRIDNLRYKIEQLKSHPSEWENRRQEARRALRQARESFKKFKKQVHAWQKGEKGHHSAGHGGH